MQKFATEWAVWSGERFHQNGKFSSQSGIENTPSTHTSDETTLQYSSVSKFSGGNPVEKSSPGSSLLTTLTRSKTDKAAEEDLLF